MNDIGGMHRNHDHDTSIDAAWDVSKFRSGLQREILEELRTRPMTDGELEKLTRFEMYGPSTVRKRRSELYQAGLVQETGERRGRFKVWGITPLHVLSLH